MRGILLSEFFGIYFVLFLSSIPRREEKRRGVLSNRPICHDSPSSLPAGKTHNFMLTLSLLLPNSVWAGITFCFTLCLCFIPYMMNSLKDVQHNCGNCRVLLATWHKSGSVDVHMHG